MEKKKNKMEEIKFTENEKNLFKRIVDKANIPGIYIDIAYKIKHNEITKLNSKEIMFLQKLLQPYLININEADEKLKKIIENKQEKEIVRIKKD